VFFAGFFPARFNGTDTPSVPLPTSVVREQRVFGTNGAVLLIFWQLQTRARHPRTNAIAFAREVRSAAQLRRWLARLEG
jgi:hypothetical protein